MYRMWIRWHRDSEGYVIIVINGIALAWSQLFPTGRIN